MEDVSDERAVDAFSAGLRRLDLVEELGRTRPKTVLELIEIASRFADGEDAYNNKRARSPDKPKYPDPSAEDMLHGPCRIHYAYLDGKRISNHLVRDCRIFLRLQDALELSQGAHKGSTTTGQGYQVQNNAGQLESKVYISAMIQPVPKSKKEQKSISRQVNLGISSPPATTEYLRWSDQPIRVSRANHPRKVPRPGHVPMVLKAQIGGYNIGRVFMDADSGINLYTQGL
jgi:hypothetical protein